MQKVVFILTVSNVFTLTEVYMVWDFTLNVFRLVPKSLPLGLYWRYESQGCKISPDALELLLSAPPPSILLLWAFKATWAASTWLAWAAWRHPPVLGPRPALQQAGLAIPPGLAASSREGTWGDKHKAQFTPLALHFPLKASPLLVPECQSETCCAIWWGKPGV